MGTFVPWLVCPWCVSEMRSRSAYKERTIYHCPCCTKAFMLSDGRAARSDGTSGAARALALIIVVFVGLPLIFIFVRQFL